MKSINFLFLRSPSIWRRIFLNVRGRTVEADLDHLVPSLIFPLCNSLPSNSRNFVSCPCVRFHSHRIPPNRKTQRIPLIIKKKNKKMEAGEQAEENDRNGVDPQEIAQEQTAVERRCECPKGAVCVCPFIPPSPLATCTSVVLLHHPDEEKHSPNHLATLSFLRLSFSRFELISEKRFYQGQVPLLDARLEAPSSSSPVLFLFPTPDSVDLSEWVRSTPHEKRTDPVLVVVDGTWSQASEMAYNSLPFLSQFATCVSLGSEDESQGGRSCEYTTLEAIARALSILEPDGGGMVVETMMNIRWATVGRGPGEPSNSKSRPKMKKIKGKG
ncbi:DTW domain-containing protein 2 [Rhynchospora pubera]|uniref:tRNA-uridine aminocarboxypropyltransferase n=1 Tax=Rhynchospora pubera TaxID=906938 RepID=A0AAV8GPR5_9POAL|nr:DTW domain-containing protein 2 [Rhynchospora pubera]